MPLAEHHQQRMALGSDITLVLVSDAPQAAIDKQFAELWRTIFAFERRFSRFLPDSELTQFNLAAGQAVPISPEFHDVLTTAAKLADQTEGLYNPFILPALQRTGYLNSTVADYATDQAPDFRERSVAPFDALQLGETTATIPYGSAVDLGGCGKGYLADILASLPAVRELAGYWFSLGGDVVAGGTDAQRQPWTVAIQDAQQPEHTLATSLVGTTKPFAVATSGTVVHSQHLIDPRTGMPAETDIVLATVKHPKGVFADVLASCAVIVGSAKAKQFLRKHGITNALLQKANGEVVEIGTFAHKQLATGGIL